MTEESKTSAAPRAKAVVDPIKIPKMKVSNSVLAKLNAWATAGATFFGWATIFVAIAGFTKKWHFSMPLLSNFLSAANTGEVPSSLIMAIAALACSIFAIVTIGKITDADALKKTWRHIASVFLALTLIYVLDMVAIILYSLMSLGRKSFSQGQLWLSSFLPTLILCVGSTAMYFVARAIVAGKTSLLRLLSIIAVAIASIAFVLVFIQQMVSFYGKSSTSGRYNSLYDLFDD